MPPLAASLAPPVSRLPSWVREVSLGLAYWLAFLLLLEPGNVMRALDAGRALVWSQEALRIGGASVLGASITPLLLALVRRFPVEGRAWVRHALVHLVASACLATLLILASLPLAAWLLDRPPQPFAEAFRLQMSANWPLLVYCIATLVAAAHAVRFLRGARAVEARPAYLSHVTVSGRGRHAVVPLETVDWIETQGNYLALHVGLAVHLLRETSVRFEARIDPTRFLRIHRQTIVAADRIEAVALIDGGDGVVMLRGGTELRLSRSYRKAVLDRLKARGSDVA